MLKLYLVEQKTIQPVVDFISIDEADITVCFNFQERLCCLSRHQCRTHQGDWQQFQRQGNYHD